MHKHTKLLPYQRREIFRSWQRGGKPARLAREYRVSRTTVYKILQRGKLGVFENMTSMNWRYRQVYFGLKRLSKTERVLAKKLAARAHRLKRYEKSEPGEQVHFDTKRLPLLPGEAVTTPREQLHVAIDDFSRFLWADILPDKTQYSSAIFLEEVTRLMPFSIQEVFSDNGPEYRGRSDHAFVALCNEKKIVQRFTKPNHPYTNGKAERVIRTLMTEWHKRHRFTSRQERRRFLYAFVQWYNQGRAHESLGGVPPLARLEAYLARVKVETVNNA